MTLPDAARRRGMGRSTLTRAARSGALQARRIGPFWVTTLDAVDAWLAQHPRMGPQPGSGTAYQSKRAQARPARDVDELRPTSSTSTGDE